MNEWRRYLLAFYSILVVGLAALLIVLTWDEGKQLDVDLGGFRLVSFIEAGDVDRILFTGLMFFIAWFALISFALALVPDRPKYRETLVIETEHGPITLTADMAASVIREEVERLPSVVQAFPSVRFTKDAVEPDIIAVLERNAHVPHAVNAIQITAERALMERFGAKMLRAGISLATPSQEEGGAPSFAPPPPPLAVRRVIRPNDGNLEFPADDGV